MMTHEVWVEALTQYILSDWEYVTSKWLFWHKEYEQYEALWKSVGVSVFLNSEAVQLIYISAINHDL